MYQDSRYGWLIRLIHSTGASFFFIFVYLHIARGLYYGSYVYREVWNIGVIILIVLIATAFLGYVLPWGQISYWGATVITNLFRAFPYIGKSLVEWMWGGFAVGNPTLTRFFALHYLLPFVILGLVVVHVLFLHQTGRNNPLGISSVSNKVAFHYYFTLKDGIFFFVMFFVFIYFTLVYGYRFMDAENFIPANSLVTPIHIQPEWYYLFAYAILRCIPNKLGGVIGLFISLLVLFSFRLFRSSHLFRGAIYRPLSRFIFWSLIRTFVLLTWLGACPAESPYTEVALLGTILYFFFILCLCIIPHFSRYYYFN